MEIDFDSLSQEELQKFDENSNQIEPQPTDTGTVEPTGTTDQPVQEKSRLQKIFGVGEGVGGTQLFDYSDGFMYSDKGPLEYYSTDFKEMVSAPGTGLADTGIDTLNLASPKGIPNIPKAETYENKAAQALRNISGLILPALGLRSMAITSASKFHAAGGMAQKAPWLYNLGNRASFQFIAKFGIDVFTGGLTDYVAEQNQKDDNLLGTFKKYWPKTFQWIPDKYATTDSDSPDQKRVKNVNEGAIFSMLASVVEGFAYLTKAGRSLENTSKFISSNKNLNVKDQFSDVIFDKDNPIQDSILRNYARKEYELDLLGQYYLGKHTDKPFLEPIVGIHDVFDETETLVISKSADGIFGASVDAALIYENIETSWGRLGNIIHEAARKEGIELNNLSRRTLVSDLTTQLKEGGPFSKRLNSNKLITDKMIDNAGKHLAATLLHPRVDSDDILGILDEFKNSVDESVMRIVGKRGINRAIKDLKLQMLDMDAQKARAYLVTSEGGQIADMSEGIRLMDDHASLNRTIDLMADRLEVLMVEKGLANFEANSMLSHMNSWKLASSTGDKEVINAAADTILDNTNSRLLEIIPEAKAWTQTLKDVARENPAWVRPLMLANEFTDGNVDSLFKLHRWAGNNLGVFKKAVIDMNPEVPSIINKAMWSNLFNSALSAISTPTKAAVGNLTGLLGKGMATISGAVIEGDISAAKKAMVAHFALDDTLQKATDHMRLVFRKASTNPKEVSYVMRGDIAIKEEKGLNILRAYADAGRAEGEYGAAALLKVYEDLDALASDPILRFGGNSMTALDGFSKSVVANTEAKYIAFNKLAQSGEEITETTFKKAYQEVYDKWFDSNGMLSSDAIDNITSEIALNADSPVVEGMNNFIKRFPIARSFIWFPRTTANVIDTFGKWSPAGILSSDYHKLWGPLGNKKMTDFSFDEMAAFLQSKGQPVDEFAEETFKRLRYEVKGKAAIGGLFSLMAFNAAINNRCTGTSGHYDKSIQRQRVKSGWKPKSCPIPGTNKQVSYEWMGPIGDWLGLMTDVVDNADTLSVSFVEDFMPKALFLLSSAFTNRSILAQLEPLHDVLQGNEAAASRWASSLANNALPLGSARTELGKLLYPGLRQLRAEFQDNLKNRNAWLDAFDPERKLPNLVDPIDGNPIGKSNWFLRVWNRGPAKVSDLPSKERQFLIDIEFNSSPMMRMSQKGVVLENHEIAAINSKMGEIGDYKDSLRRIMNRANNMTYTSPDGVTYTGFINIIKAQRQGLISSEILDHSKYGNVFNEIKLAYSQAKSYAEHQLQFGNDAEQEIWASIQERAYQEDRNDYNMKSENLNEVLNIAK